MKINGVIVTLVLAAAVRGEADNGQCTVQADCEVRSASCVGSRCSIVKPLEWFPDQPDLTEIELADPGQLGQVGTAPEFHWVPPVGVDRIAVAVMPVLPTYSMERPDRIANFQATVWVWDSSLPGGSTAATGARFEEGRGLLYGSDSDHQVLTSGPPPKLLSGVYYWGVWAWTGSGSALTHRSLVRTFVVGSEGITGTPCTGCGGAAALRCVKPLDYCIVACASDVDCYQGSTCDLSNLTAAHSWGVCRTQPKGCDCGVESECDTDLGLCYQSAHAADACDNSSSCRAADFPGAMAVIVVTVMLVFRRRRAS